jgi:hypothetical protein
MTGICISIFCPSLFVGYSWWKMIPYRRISTKAKKEEGKVFLWRTELFVCRL